MQHEWGRRGKNIGFWWERKKERYNYEDLDVGGRIILRWIVEKYDGVVWTGFIWLGIRTSGAHL
jgi:hypothetical protein